MNKKSTLFKRKRYWYHLSDSLNQKVHRLIPWTERQAVNRSATEIPGKRICVAPTIEQCITALPYSPSSEYNIYRTKEKVLANEPIDIFDSKITIEGWICIPTTFVKIRKIDFSKIIEKRFIIDQ